MAKKNRRGLVVALTLIMAIALIVSVSAMQVFAAGNNVATSATVSTSYCSSWETLGAVNDGVVTSTSYEANSSTHPHYGSWGNTSSSETITYTWSSAVTIGSCGIEFWYDDQGGAHNASGIDIPESYTFHYKNSSGNWVNVSNASGYGIAENVLNQTTFPPVTTTGLRITMNKSASSSYGLGVTEWEVYTASAATTTKKTTTTTQAQQQTGNIAPNATVTSDHCSSWEDVTGVNDGAVNSTSYEANSSTHKHFGSWGTTASTDTITYTWSSAQTINGCGIFFWYDDTNGQHNASGIDIPESYSYQYLNGSGNWVNVSNASGLGIAQDVFNQTTFTPVTTTGLRIIMNKSSNSSYGLGVTEWEVYGAPAGSNPTGTTTKKTTTTTKATTTQTQPQNGTNIAGSAYVEAPNCSSWETVGAVNDGVIASTSYEANSNTTPHYGSWGTTASYDYITYTWDGWYNINKCGLFFWYDDTNGQHNASGIDIPESYSFEYLDYNTGDWKAVTGASGLGIAENVVNQTTFNTVLTQSIRVKLNKSSNSNYGLGVTEWQVFGTSAAAPATTTKKTTTTTRATASPNADGTITSISGGYRMTNNYFYVETGSYGQITVLRIQNDDYATNYVMNASNTSGQSSAAGHQWMGELMFKVKVGNASSWTEQNTGRSSNGRSVAVNGKQIVVTYQNDSAAKGINKFKLTEIYELRGNQLHWEMTVTNTNSQNLTIGDWGVPLAFNEYWTMGDEIYETRAVDHSFVGLDSSYIYITRPSGIGKFLLMTPDTSTGAKFEYQDHWRTNERASDEKNWCQDQSNWQNGLNVFYIHSDVIKSTKRGYLPNTSLVLGAGQSKTYAFNFTVVNDESSMKSVLYDEGIVDAVAVPGMAYSVNMPGKLYLHTPVAANNISFTFQCPHETGLHAGNSNTVCNNMSHTKSNSNTYATFVKTVNYNGEQYHVYDLHFKELGQHNVYVNYNGKQTCLQFYMMDDLSTILNLHANFMVNKTQINDNSVGRKAFDDWMMDNKTVRANVEAGYYWTQTYWGWGDDWGLVHGTFLAEKNVYQPVASQIQALDDYLTVCIWGSLMNGHHSDYKINDFLVESYVQSGASTLCYRGYAYPHIYNTYFAMYKIAKRYPNMISYDESYTSYLLKAYNIMKALYGSGVSYNWSTGVMGELTTPDIINCLKAEGYTSYATTIEGYMNTKYNNFKNARYPYGSEYSYDNTGEEAVYTLAKMKKSSDSSNALRMMRAIDLKTRACRGMQPIWYAYSVPVTNCGENWWQFQYTISLAGYCMDDYLRFQSNGWNDTQRAEKERLNYAAKLGMLTCINSGQIDADSANIGTVGWTYQAEMGNLGGQGTGGGKLHNGWRQMAGEADLGLYGAMKILSADVSNDPIFGLFGYGCTISESNGSYTVTPLDGLYTRLNFINKKLYIDILRDQYTQAVVKTDNSSVQLTMKNVEKTSHTSTIDITGLATGTYSVKVNGSQQSTFTVSSTTTTYTVSVNMPASTNCTVLISK